jgi:cell division protein FtsQ
MAKLALASTERLGVPSRDQLLQRRQQLRQRRRNQFVQGSWRIGMTLGVLAGLVLGLRQPYWQLQDPEQIRIVGNTLLSDEQIRAQVALDYPVSLWHVEPQAIEQALLQGGSEFSSSPAPIRLAHVQRQLIPAGLLIQVEERQPVARGTVDGVAGFIDQEGVWLSLQNYPDLTTSNTLPALSVIGWENHSPRDWATILQTVQSSPIQIHAIDWKPSGTLSLTTELGEVFLGSFSPQMQEQLKALEQMRDLKQYCRCDPKDIDYIDLSSPKVPTIQLTSAAAQKRWGTSETP